MYEQFYGLRDKPFSLTPNPRFVFYSQQYHEAQNQLLYGISNREGFMLVTGQPGTGKTTLCRDLIEKLDREKSQSALIFNPFLNGMEMLAALLTEFGINVPEGGTRKELLDRLNQFLLAQLAMGKSCVAIFDEAQHLAPEFLEQIRVLSNLETDQEKLIQIILVGQPELLDKIRTPQMSQLDQRVSIRCSLSDLNEQETDRYIHHRLNVAGARGQVRFSPRAVKEIYRGSHGVPRLINLICDRALLAGYASQTRDIQPSHVMKAIAALRGEDLEVKANTSAPPPSRGVGRRIAIVTAAATLGLAGIAAASVAIWPKLQKGPADEQLYQKTYSAASAVDAERDLIAFVAHYPESKHFDEALLRLARLELSRGDRASAVQHLSQLAQHAPPAGIHHTSALVLGAQAQLDNGDTTSACQSITPDLAAAAAPDTTLALRLTEVSSVCASRITSEATPVVDSAALKRAKDSTAKPAPRRRPAPRAAAPQNTASPQTTTAPPPVTVPPPTTPPPAGTTPP